MFTDINNSAQSLIASLTSSAPFSSDLEELQNILHFPEEVALRLTDAEYQLYYQVRRQRFVFIAYFVASLSGSRREARGINEVKACR
jgi:hypothetical protein